MNKATIVRELRSIVGCTAWADLDHDQSDHSTYWRIERLLDRVEQLADRVQAAGDR